MHYIELNSENVKENKAVLISAAKLRSKFYQGRGFAPMRLDDWIHDVESELKRGTRLIIAQEKGVSLGFVGYRIPLLKSDNIQIIDHFTRRGARTQGVGKKLVYRVVGLARKEGFAGVRIIPQTSVGIDFSRAIARKPRLRSGRKAERITVLPNIDGIENQTIIKLRKRHRPR